MKTVFTTGEIAKICNISQQTVIRCFDSGRLKGFRVPGSKFRRATRETLIAFMKENFLPLDKLESGKKRVLIVDDDAAIVEMLEDLLTRDGRFEVRTASNGFDAGAMTQSFRPDVVLLDYMLPDINGNIVCKRIKGNEELSTTKIMIISGTASPSEVEMLRQAGADDFVQKPFDVQKLIERIAELIDV